MTVIHIHLASHLFRIVFLLLFGRQVISLCVCVCEFVVVQLLSCVSLLPHGLQHTRLPCLSPTPRSLLKLMSVESVMPCNYLILSCPLPLNQGRTQVSCIAGRFLTVWAAREAHFILLLNKIPLNGCTTVCFSIHWLKDMSWLLLIFGNYE